MANGLQVRRQIGKEKMMEIQIGYATISKVSKKAISICESKKLAEELLTREGPRQFNYSIVKVLFVQVSKGKCVIIKEIHDNDILDLEK